MCYCAIFVGMANAITRFFTKRAHDPLGNPNKSVWSYITGLFTGSNTVTIDEEAVLAITPAWRAINIIGDIMATMPLGLYEKEKDGDINLVENHSLHKLIAVNPSPLYTPYTWMKTMLANAILSGNAIAKIHWNGSAMAAALEIIPYDELHDIILSEDGTSLTYIFHNRKPIKSDDVIHFKGLSLNGMAAINPTNVHKNTYSSAAGLRDYLKNYLEKGAFLSGVVENPGVLRDDVYKRAKESWNSAFGGSGKAGGTAFLEGGASYKPIQQNLQQSSVDTVKSAIIADISRITGVPEYMLDSKNKPTYSSVEQMSIDFKKYTIDGWITNIKQELTRKLVPTNSKSKYYYDFDSTGLTMGDILAMAEAHTKYFRIGALNRDEIRSFLKKNNVEGGDRYFVEGNNMIPVDAVDTLIEMKQNKNGSDTPQPDVNTLNE